MNAPSTLATTPARPRTRMRDLPAKMRPTDPTKLRLAALRRFAVGITILNIAGHLFLGFEQTIAQLIVVVLTCYVTELAVETLVAARDSRRPGYLPDADSPSRRTRVLTLVNFLLAAHISGCALGMLLFVNDRLDLFVVAAVVAISSKYLFRVRARSGDKHYFNPSNFGITVVLLLFADTVSIAPPYQFTEYLGHLGQVALPAFLACIGLFINFIFTGKLPLIFAWVGGFTAQAAIRAFFDEETSFLASIAPLTGMALLLFTLYMITDPGTTPRSKLGQVEFGLSVAAVYGTLMAFHVAFAFFFALTIVCACRGIGMWMANTAAWQHHTGYGRLRSNVAELQRRSSNVARQSGVGSPMELVDEQARRSR
ncbi:enediyne biosynthesis protein [Amycolatopsis sp. NPDC059021]|uniref:enediyne biosynthesis protein n=1 Tax=Amycolatopsis sp. NPDC059021 TaxID=3346704 RepID=UPI00367148F4